MLAFMGACSLACTPTQANKWIKAMEGSDLTVVDLNTKDFLRQMGNCIQYGLPCLLQVKAVLYIAVGPCDRVSHNMR